MLATTPSTKKVMLPVTRPWAKKPRESPIEGLRRVVPKKIRRRFFMDPATLILSRVAMSCWGHCFHDDVFCQGTAGRCVKIYLNITCRQDIIVIILLGTFHLRSHILAGWKHTISGMTPKPIEIAKIDPRFLSMFLLCDFRDSDVLYCSYSCSRKMHNAQVQINPRK